MHNINDQEMKLPFALSIFTFFFVSCTLPLPAQECSCVDNFNWVKDNFEENDAGFAYALETKGKAAYEKHNEIFLEKVKGISAMEECRPVLYEWLTFFRSGHIAIRGLNQPQTSSTNEEQSKQEILDKYKDWEKLEVDAAAFPQYLDNLKEVGYEGIWESPPYKIGIKKIEDEYIGFIIEADGVYWTPGQVKLKIQVNDQEVSSTFYMRDHSPQNFDDATLVGNNFLQLGFVTLQRTYPEIETDAAATRYFKSISADDPYFEQLDEKTAFLRIPSFSHSNKKAIDQVIETHLDEMLQSKHLIIDLRNNGGGSDASYRELLPIIYTNPIRTVGVAFWSTPLNNQRMLDFVNDPEYGFDEEGKKWAQESYDKLSQQLGQFVDLDDEIVSITKLDEVHPYPENVAILINENNGSTTEQFLLAAKQSRKVKLFGTTTFGVLDISNMYFVKSPCEEFELGYCLTRSMRIPEMTIDEKGIQPDYYIDQSIPKYKWIDFVREVLPE